MVGAAGSTSTASPTPATSRWNPTPEQLLALEEMYKRGVRIPTADQIQQIASQLSRFGKIEGKNVFYWFQNHKARERQKRRREGENNSKMLRHDVEIPDKRESGMRRTVHGELQPTKNSFAPSHCTKNIEGLVPMHRAAANKAENRTHGWSQFQERKSPQQKNTSTLINHDRWQNGFLSSSSYPPPMFNESSFPSNPKFLTFEGQHNFSNALEDEAREIQTLQLFPLCGGENDDYEGMVRCTKKDTKVPITTINTKFSPGQFFEFLPLKN